MKKAPGLVYEHEIPRPIYLLEFATCLFFICRVVWFGHEHPQVLNDNAPYLSVVYAVAGLFCLFLTIVGFRATLGMRYGNYIRIFPGYMEVALFSPARTLTSKEIDCFRAVNSFDGRSWRIQLLLKSGKKIKLPPILDGDVACQCMVREVGLFQSIG